MHITSLVKVANDSFPTSLGPTVLFMGKLVTAIFRPNNQSRFNVYLSACRVNHHRNFIVVTEMESASASDHNERNLHITSTIVSYLHTYFGELNHSHER